MRNTPGIVAPIDGPAAGGRKFARSTTTLIHACQPSPGILGSFMLLRLNARLRDAGIQFSNRIAVSANGSETWTLTDDRLHAPPSGRVGCFGQIVAGIDAVHSRTGRIPALVGNLVPLIESGFDCHKIFHFLLT
jgi:hypothetical protein